MFEDNQPQQQPTEQQVPVQEPAQPAPEQANQPQQPAEPAAPGQPAQPAQPAKPAAKPVKTSQDEKMWAAIGYIAFLGLVTMAMKPKSEFCRKHASQGLVLFVIWFVGLILLAIGSFLSAIGGILMLGATILAVIGIIKAISSYEFKLPVLTDIAKAVPVDAIVGSMTGKKAEAPKQQPAQKPEEAQQGQAPQQPAESAAPVAPAEPATEAPKVEEPKPEEPKAEEPKEPTPPAQPQQ